VARIEKLLATGSDKNTLTYVMARTWASAKQWPETAQWLRKAVGLMAGLDPSRDSVFAELRGAREFDAILKSVDEATPPVLHSDSVFKIDEGDLAPESMAYDPVHKRFYFGSLRKGKVVGCSRAGDCSDFASVSEPCSV
jgi:hypothetical protein